MSANETYRKLLKYILSTKKSNLLIFSCYLKKTNPYIFKFADTFGGHCICNEKSPTFSVFLVFILSHVNVQPVNGNYGSFFTCKVLSQHENLIYGMYVKTCMPKNVVQPGQTAIRFYDTASFQAIAEHKKLLTL